VWPRRSKVTVCIAASCFGEREEPQIVLCHDWLGSIPAAGSIDTIDKQRFLGNNWMGLMAGDVARADELTGTLEGRLPAKVTSNQAIAIVRKAVFDYRKMLLDQSLLGSCGITFDRFIDDGQKIYPESVFKEIQRDIVEVRLGIEFIVTGFVTEREHEKDEDYLTHCLIQVCERERGVIEVTMEDSFACIGEGASAAQTFMMFRDHDRFDDLMKTVYQVFEAKTMAELNPSVGTSTSVYLQRPGKALAYMDGKGFDHFYKLFGEFGPRSIKRKTMKQHPITPKSFTDDRMRMRTEAAKRGALPDSVEVKRLGSETSEDQEKASK
jgi:hypothetical protein